MFAQESDATLVTRARTGDKEAFGILVMRYRRRVAGIAWRMTGDAAVTDDIAQAVFLRAWSQLGTLRDPAHLPAWLSRLAVRSSIDLLRRTRHEGELDDAEADRTGNPEREVLAQERAQAVCQAVLALPPQCRAALILREYEGLSYREIAETLEIPVGTVMSRLNYARGLLRKALAAYVAQMPEGQ